MLHRLNDQSVKGKNIPQIKSAVCKIVQFHFRIVKYHDLGVALTDQLSFSFL